MIQLIFGFLGILIGTGTDIKKREVPDWVNFTMMGSGVGLAAMASVHGWTIWPLLFSLAGLLLGFLLGALMYYTGQWGGGDAKMIMGVGALSGLPLLPSLWSTAPFLIVFLIWTVLVGAVYGIFWMFILFVSRRSEVLPVLKERLHRKGIIRIRLMLIVVAIVLIIIALILRNILSVFLLVLGALGYLTFFLSMAVKAVEAVCFVKEIPVSKLVEGDWIVGSIKKGKKVLVEDNNTGITKEQIVLLKKMKVRDVTVKEGIPFVPSFLIAFLIAVWWWSAKIPLLFWV